MNTTKMDPAMGAANGQTNQKRKSYSKQAICALPAVLFLVLKNITTALTLQPYQVTVDDAPAAVPGTRTPNDETADAAATTAAVAPVRIDTREHPPTIYYCTKGGGGGVGEARKIFAAVLPEFDFVKATFEKHRDKEQFQSRLAREGRNQPYDFFLKILRGGCSSGMVEHWIQDVFRGNVLFVTGENCGDYLPQRMQHKFVIGPVLESQHERVLTLTYLQMVWYKVFRPLFDVGGKYYVESERDRANATANEGDASSLPPPERMLIDPSLRPRGNATDFLIYAASNCVEFREVAFVALSTLGRVHYGGKCRGDAAGGRSAGAQNVTKIRNDVSLKNWWSNLALYGRFRFCLVMEHAKEEAYVTEKILMAFLGGCVPIYYG